MSTRLAGACRISGSAGEETIAQIEGILFQPDAIGDYRT